MGKPMPTAALCKSSIAAPSLHPPKGRPRESGAPADATSAWADAARGVISIVVSILLAVTMIPVAGIQTAYADDPVERPATSGGDVALQSVDGDAAASDADEAQVPIVQQREDGMQVADGLVYTVADGGLAFVGFDIPEGADAKSLVVPSAVNVDGRNTPVVAIDVADGQVADGVVTLSVPQSIESINTASLASAFPSLLSIEVAATGSSLPVAAEAVVSRATYSSFGGALLCQTVVNVEREDGAIEATQCRELVWVPPATPAVRVPVDCLSLAPGAFVGVRDLKTVVCFGNLERIAQAERDDEGVIVVQGAFTDEQLENATIVFPAATPAVPSEGEGRIAASMALNDAAIQADKRHAWIELGLPLERLSMGKPTGALTETVAVDESGVVSADEARLISYPDMHPRATDVKHPNENGVIDMAENGLAFTYLSDMTLSVTWKGDKTATPSHLDIPAFCMIDNVEYSVTEIAAGAFKDAVFLTSVSLPEGIRAIGESAFENCTNLAEVAFPASLKTVDYAAFAGTTVIAPTFVSNVAVGGNAFVEATDASFVTLPTAQQAEQPEVTSDAQRTEQSVASEEVAIDGVVANDTFEMDTDNVDRNDQSMAPYADSDTVSFRISIIRSPGCEDPSLALDSAAASIGWSVGESPTYKNDHILVLQVTGPSTCQGIGVLTTDIADKFESGKRSSSIPIQYLFNNNRSIKTLGTLNFKHSDDYNLIGISVFANNSATYINANSNAGSDMVGPNNVLGIMPVFDYDFSGKISSKANINTVYNANAHQSNFGTEGNETIRGVTDGLARADEALNNRITALEGKTHLTLAGTGEAATAARSDHTHSEYATKTSLSSYVTTTALTDYVKKSELGDYSGMRAAVDHQTVVIPMVEGLSHYERDPRLSDYVAFDQGSNSITMNTIAGKSRYLGFDCNGKFATYDDGNNIDLYVHTDDRAADVVGSLVLYTKSGYRLAGYRIIAPSGGKYVTGGPDSLAYCYDNEITLYPIIEKDTTYDLSGYALKTDLDSLRDDMLEKSAIGTIRYSNIEYESDHIYPDSYIAGSRPGIPAPRRDGYRFKGWIWSRDGETGDNLHDAFSVAGQVHLDAQWEIVEPDDSGEPDAKYFFTQQAPLTVDGASPQTHVIKVKLANVQKKVSRISIEGNDTTGLVKDSSRITFHIDTKPDVDTADEYKQIAWGGESASRMAWPLVDFGDGSYGLYVAISVPTDAINADSIPSSYVDGSYVASLIKMHYTFE